MHATKSAVAALRSWSRTRSYDDGVGSYAVGLIVGFVDGYDEHWYDDGHCTPHQFTVCVPDAGSSAFAHGYRDGFLSGQAVRYKNG